MKLIQSNGYMGTVDLQDAYYAVSVAECHRKFLRFKFNGVIYEFTCLFFGLCAAPQVFTKFFKPVISLLRKSNYKSVLYLDDFLLLGDTYKECVKNINITVKTLEMLGFIINVKKSKLIPSRNCKYLGFIFDSVSMTLQLPQEKRLSIKILIDKYSKLFSCKIRDFAQFIGSVTTCCRAIKYGWVYTKNFERHKLLALQANNNKYDSIMQLHSNTADFNW